MSHFEKYSIGKRNLQCENHWEGLDPKTFRITKPTVLCFGGNTTTTPEEANAVCKIAQNLVGAKQPSTENEFATLNDVNFIGIAYGKDRESSRTGYLSSEEHKELAQSIFLPLCLDEKGSTLPKEQILKNFNQITLFSHCYGTFEIASIIEESCQEMHRLGINRKTMFEALDQVFSVSYAPFQKCGCPTLQVVPMIDKELRSGPLFSEITGEFLTGKFGKTKGNSSGTVAFMENPYTVSVLVSNMLENRLDEHPVYLVDRNENWQYTRNLTTGYGDKVSQVMGNALASSVANSIQNQNSDTFTPKPTLDEILEETQSILAETQDSELESTINQIKAELYPHQTEAPKVSQNVTLEESQSSALETSGTPQPETITETTKLETFQGSAPLQTPQNDITPEQN